MKVNKMNIVYIIRELDITLSPNTVIFNIINNIEANIKIISIGKVKNRQNNYENILIKKNISYKIFDSIEDTILNIKTIAEFIKNTDILHLEHYKAFVIGDILHRLNKNLKIVSVCHSDEVKEKSFNITNGNHNVLHNIQLLEKQLFYKKHYRVVAVSNYVKDYLHSIDCKHTEVIHNGIDYDNFTFTQYASNDIVQLCQIGHVFSLKNQFYSLKLIKFLIENDLKVKLHIIGSLSKNKRYVRILKQFIYNNNLDDHIIFHNFLDNKQLSNILTRMDILLMPSYVEGLPLALLEAFYFQLPAIVSQYGGMKEVMNQENGIIVDIDNNDFEKIYTYIKSKKYIVDGKNARKLALKKYTAKTMANKYFTLYKNIIDENNIFNKLYQKRIFLYPYNDIMIELSDDLHKNKVYSHAFIDNEKDEDYIFSTKIVLQNYDYIIVDEAYINDNLLLEFEESKIIIYKNNGFILNFKKISILNKINF